MERVRRIIKKHVPQATARPYAEPISHITKFYYIFLAIID